MRLAKERANKHWAQAAAIAGATALLVFVASKSLAFNDFNRYTYDFTVVNAGLTPPSKNVVMVDFDDETFNRIQRYPIPWSTVGQVIRRVGEGKPRIIGMDWFLSETRGPEEDKAMLDALTSAGVVILAAQSAGGNLPQVNPLPIFCVPEDVKETSGFCKDDRPGAFGYALITLPIDADGFIRESNLFDPGKKPTAEFPLMLAQQYSGKTIEPVDTKRARFLGHDVYYAHPPNQTTMLPGSWGREPATTIPAWKVLSGEVGPEAFADKLVLMGQSSDAARDRHYTPLFRTADATGLRLMMGGTQVHATAIRSLLEGTVVRPAPDSWRWGAELIYGFVACFLFLRLRTAIGLPVTFVMLLVPVAAALLLYAKARFWMPFLPLQMEIAGVVPLALGLQFIEERVLSQEAHAMREQLMTLFASYVDPAVANTIWERRNEVSLNGEERTATVMFTDIRSFTALSAGKPPAEVLHWLNVYCTAMDEVIRLHGGFLNKFIGDGLMIIFGLPLSQGVHDDAKRALHCAIAMLERVLLLNREHEGNPAMPSLRIGCGIHTGKLMAGSIGSATRQEYSVIGETVNLASRLESLNKQFKTEILMSQATYDILVNDFVGYQSLGTAKVAGFEEPVPVFTITPPPKRQ